MEPVIARKCWRTLEPLHGLVYFAPEAADAYAALGLHDRAGYFASRSAAMGPVGADVVVATFYNFHPALVRRSIPAAWEAASPAAVLEARLAAAGAALRRALGGDGEGGPDAGQLGPVLDLLRPACEVAAGRPEGRPLFAAHAALAWPGEPLLDLWHAVTLLREFRGDGHVAALTAAGVSGCEALVMHAGTGEVPAETLRATRAWPLDEWEAAVESLRTRGWIDATGMLTDAGRAERDAVEARTDELALAPWAAIEDEGCERVRAVARPWSRAVVGSGVFG